MDYLVACAKKKKKRKKKDGGFPIQISTHPFIVPTNIIEHKIWEYMQAPVWFQHFINFCFQIYQSNPITLIFTKVCQLPCQLGMIKLSCLHYHKFINFYNKLKKSKKHSHPLHIYKLIRCIAFLLFTKLLCLGYKSSGGVQGIYYIRW